MENKVRHIAIIPDGNRRWAKAHARELFLGHEEGAKAIEKISGEAMRKGIRYLTVWGLSVDNVTKRSKQEVDFLFALFEKYFTKLLDDPILSEKNVRVNIIGRWKEFFPDTLQATIQKLITKTESHQDFTFTFLMAYSGIDEMIDTVRAVVTSSSVLNFRVSEQAIKNNLWTRDLPPVDLVIRTGGEPHWSQGFMMWDVADAQLYFTETLWPDFNEEEFSRAIDAYVKRERRFGK